MATSGTPNNQLANRRPDVSKFPAFIRAPVKAILDYVDRNLAISGDFIDVSAGENGRSVNLQPMGALTQAFPFQIYLIAPTDPSNPIKAWINEESSLLTDEEPDDSQEITGLGKDAAFTLASDKDLIWLEITWNPDITGDIDTATINSLGMGGTFDPTFAAWDDSNNAYIASSGGTPPFQNILRVPIAQITYDETTNAPIINQMLRDNVVLILRTVALQAAYTSKTPYGSYQSDDGG